MVSVGDAEPWVDSDSVVVLGIVDGSDEVVVVGGVGIEEVVVVVGDVMPLDEGSDVVVGGDVAVDVGGLDWAVVEAVGDCVVVPAGGRCGTVSSAGRVSPSMVISACPLTASLPT